MGAGVDNAHSCCRSYGRCLRQAFTCLTLNLYCAAGCSADGNTGSDGDECHQPAADDLSDHYERAGLRGGRAQADEDRAAGGAGERGRAHDHRVLQPGEDLPQVRNPPGSVSLLSSPLAASQQHFHGLIKRRCTGLCQLAEGTQLVELMLLLVSCCFLQPVLRPCS